MNIINELLFKTNAVRVAPAQEPFWYTSGKLGPFYINTHFLAKDEQTANEMLTYIENHNPKEIEAKFENLYNTDSTYKTTIDELIKVIEKYDFDIISGGERRDFFFSMVPAKLLGKQHLTIYKDKSFVLTDSNFDEAEPTGNKVLHIADLITEASSYERAWIPVIREQGLEITDTVAIVDRKQNGRKVLEDLGVNMETLTAIDKALFDHAKDTGAIDEDQYNLVMKFLENPDTYMQDFLKNNPNFIKDQIAMGGKAKQRAELAIEKGYATL